MFIRKYESSDFEILKGFGREILPDPFYFSKNNYFVRENGEDFIFFTVYFVLDAPIAIIDNFMSKKGTSLKKIFEALEVIFNYLKAFFKNIKDMSGAEIKLIKISVHDRLKKGIERFLPEFKRIQNSNSFLLLL